MNFKPVKCKAFNLIMIASVVLFTLACNSVVAQNKSTKTNGDDNDSDNGDVSTTVTPHSSDAIFKTNAVYTYAVKNTFSKTESGNVSYLVTDQFNKKLLADSVRVNIGKKSTKSFDFTIPALKSSFYKISFMINVSDYDDTTRRVFGIRADEIRSPHQKPADFDTFWQNTKAELAAVKPQFSITEKPALEKFNQKVYLIQMQSWGNITIRGWMTLPAHQSKHKKFPVLVMLPGYQATTQPLVGVNDDMAFISVDVRGQGLNRDVMNMRREDYIIYRLEDKNKYYLRGVIMDCLRYIDFVCSRPELDQSRIAITGGSMGGYMSITTAALDKRVTMCGPQNPFMSDIYDMDNGAVKWPIDYMKAYVKIRPGLTFDKVLNNLQYYDAKNFASLVTCPVLMGIGLLDPFVPPNNSYIVYNSFSGKKKIIVFKDLGHEVGKKYSNYEALWMRDTFGLY